MSNWYSIFCLVLAGILLYYLFSQLLGRKKYKVQDLFNDEYVAKHEKKSDSERFASLKNNALTKWIYPAQFIHEANKYDWDITVMNYWLLVSLGGAVGSFLLSIFNLGAISIFGFGAGFLVPRTLLSIRRLKYKKEIEQQLITYMKAVSNAISSSGGNVTKTLESITPMLKEPIKTDVEYCLSLHRGGTSIQESFKLMDEKYEYSDLVFFHSMLDAAHRNGKEFFDILDSTANEFEQKKVLQAKLSANMAQVRRAFFQNNGIVIVVLIGGKFFVTDIFNSTFNSPIGKLILLFILFSTIFSYVKVQKHCEFDPSEAQ
ncbi:hypothetical protein [Cytobacillus sp. IB215665]|uniref:type II secretion system F family protein n=1 Tax=Cytobacillus sp. IB215665 TaxID=3097357 RepID=UPI002A133498|nr:hypothetical protein [Cytobacillus sp. IB215665]MDX8367197.1 hypothetical protein [Cytobacillus sp. IB215665]